MYLVNMGMSSVRRSYPHILGSLFCWILERDGPPSLVTVFVEELILGNSRAGTKFQSSKVHKITYYSLFTLLLLQTHPAAGTSFRPNTYLGCEKKSISLKWLRLKSIEDFLSNAKKNCKCLHKHSSIYKPLIYS